MELLEASGWGCRVRLEESCLAGDRGDLPCLGLDPLGLISSGSLLITAPPEVPSGSSARWESRPSGGSH